MRIIHISDFHIDSNNLEDLRNYVIKPLVEDLIMANNDKRIEMIAFSGDLVDKGGLSFDKDIELAFYTFQEEVIEPLINAINLPLHRFFFVPGNHDVVRSADKEVIEVGLKSVLTNSEKVNTFIDSRDEDGIKRVLPFKIFEKEYFKDFHGEHQLSNFQSAFKWESENKKIGVTCFNSSWRCYDSEKDYQNIILGERQVTRAREIIEDCDIKIGILHHPLDEYAPFESKQIESMLIKDYDILLFGHVHEGSNWSKTNMAGSTIISIAPSNWTTNVRSRDLLFANGYSIIDFSRGLDVKIKHRRYSHHKEGFVANTDLGDDSGKTVYKLPSASEMIKRENEYIIIEKIKDVHLNSIDQHLISYETDTQAPKRIEDMFVLPRIVQKEEEKITEEEVYSATEKTFSIEEICNSDENLLLVGVKEAGKTILLDKILIELTNNYEEYKKIPVYINFEEAASNKIETILSKYLNIGILSIKKDILKYHNIVLLIDNIKFEDKYKVLLTNLEHFLNEYPNVSVIASCTSRTEEEIPIEALNFNILGLFKPAFIKSFRTKEIRKLMGKWFGINSKLINSSEELEKLIKTFGALNLPRTPLAVSMFLWIIEKQENYAPVNNAQMLENFLERLFTKTSSHEIYSSEFNYKNKERLLTEIALFMYEENQVNYRLNYQSLRNFIYNNLKIKMFDFDEEALLNHFIQRGIFSVEKEGVNRYVKFKFTCFFQFFLMKNIDINKEFKKHVLSEKYYLHFVDELDYYSGLKIDDVELLELTVNRMYNEYNFFLSKIEQIQYSYDNHFETLNTIVNRLSHSDIEEITSQDKQTEEDEEREHDKQLSDNHDTKITKKDDNINPIARLERLWVLAAKVLKNTEEIKVENLKSEAFSKVIRCSMAFATIYKYAFTKYQEKASEQEEDDEKDGQMEIIMRLLPLIHQVVVYQTLGTGKLKIVLQDKIENIIENDSISDFEKFLCVFIYADLKGKNNIEYIGLLIKNIKRYYIKDMIFMKLLEYYYRKDTTRIEEGNYKNLLGNLLTRDDGDSMISRDFHRKGEFIAKLEKTKREKMLLGNVN
ncbi:metallophosphoesterase [Peribacillus frigoritolerans]